LRVLRVVALGGEFEEEFWRHVSQDKLDFYFFILDWRLHREQTRIYLALDDGGGICGLLLIYKDAIVQVRGNREAVEALLKFAPEKLELSAPIDCRELVLKSYPALKLNETLMLMTLKKGEETLKMTARPQRLTAEDAVAMAELMVRVNPAVWGITTPESLIEMFADTVWMGIKHGQKLASFGTAFSKDTAGHIMCIATDEQFRNRGYATSITSALTKQILKKSPSAVIHVFTNNAPAVRAYSKVGFKPYRQYVLIRT
jgi:ribosomal protein S18 acetylase RimI-like enzyme